MHLLNKIVDKGIHTDTAVNTFRRERNLSSASSTLLRKNIERISFCLLYIEEKKIGGEISAD